MHTLRQISDQKTSVNRVVHLKEDTTWYQWENYENKLKKQGKQQQQKTQSSNKIGVISFQINESFTTKVRKVMGIIQDFPRAKAQTMDKKRKNSNKILKKQKNTDDRGSYRADFEEYRCSTRQL